MSTDDDYDRLVPRGSRGSNHEPHIVLRSQAYRRLLEATRSRLPSETVGALVGTFQDRGGRVEVLITGAVPISLVSSGLGVAPNEEEWAELRGQIASEASELAGLDERIVGWFYADPGIGIFPPRIDVAEAHAALAPEARLFLLVNPANDCGAFYNWRDGDFAPIGGFYEALEAGGEEAIIPWDGKVPGAAAWLRGQGAAPEVGGGGVLHADQERQERAVVRARGRRMRLVTGVVLGLVVAAALVGSLFLFGRERQATPLPSPVETVTPSPIPTAQATAPSSPPQAVPSQLVPGQIPPVPVATTLETLPTSVGTSIPAVTATMPGVIDTATVTQPTVTPIQPLTYTVSSGDSLSAIANSFNTTVEAIMAANNLDSTVIIPGQVLIIPTQGGPGDEGTVIPIVTSTGVVTSISPVNSSPTEVIPQAVPSAISTADSR
ncbi:MAG TPA: LysM peptidoglycan-binding domain-containing protein [Chloroflexia bacterium]|nr:LysM peptidoglycan-binding domain-containing protein [Chloroflexia bacterium]